MQWFSCHDKSIKIWIFLYLSSVHSATFCHLYLLLFGRRFFNGRFALVKRSLKTELFPPTLFYCINKPHDVPVSRDRDRLVVPQISPHFFVFEFTLGFKMLKIIKRISKRLESDTRGNVLNFLTQFPWFIHKIASQTPFSRDMIISIIWGFSDVVRWRRSSSFERLSILVIPALRISKWWIWCSRTIQLNKG